jgi:hypothetical protein
MNNAAAAVAVAVAVAAAAAVARFAAATATVIGLLLALPQAFAAEPASAQNSGSNSNSHSNSSSRNPHRLDDSRSHPAADNVKMQWLPQNSSEPNAGMQTTVRVNIHIDTTEWQGRSGRVYMVLPRDQAGSTVEAEWTTNGRLLPGRLASGERSLVYAGRIDGPALQDEMQVRLRTAPDWQSETRRLNFYFEIDVLD